MDRRLAAAMSGPTRRRMPQPARKGPLHSHDGTIAFWIFRKVRLAADRRLHGKTWTGRITPMRATFLWDHRHRDRFATASDVALTRKRQRSRVLGSSAPQRQATVSTLVIGSGAPGTPAGPGASLKSRPGCPADPHQEPVDRVRRG